MPESRSDAAKIDENMRDLFDQGRLALFAKWISGANDPEVRAYVALCISNMARKGMSVFFYVFVWLTLMADEYCIAIANSAVVAPLLDMLKSTNVKEVNGAVGVFRNLVLPGAFFCSFYSFFLTPISRQQDAARRARPYCSPDTASQPRVCAASLPRRHHPQEPRD